jgi:hypothetical protein
MRSLKLFLLLLLVTLPVASAEPITLSATVSLLDNEVLVGSDILLMVKITNTTKHRLFIDEHDLRISTSVEYPDRSGILGPYTSRGIASRSHGGPLPIVHLHEHTLGIEPGESFIKFTRLYSSMLVRPEKVTVHAHVTFPGANDLSIKGEDWSEFEASAELVTKLRVLNAR